jgi:photosystem II stability/assembly factor-like uncharacterized protein
MNTRAIALLVTVTAGGLAAAPASQSAPKIPATALTVVAFTSPRSGFGYFNRRTGSRCTAVVARTADGGATFTAPHSVTSAGCARGLSWQLTSDGRGDVFLYGPGVFASHDGGRSWHRMTAPGRTVAVVARRRSIWLLRLSCKVRPISSPVRCRLHLMTSADGGLTWRAAVRQPVPSQFLMANVGLAYPANGQDWLVRTDPASAYVLLPPPVRPHHSGPPAPLLATTDGGRSWTRHAIPCGRGLWSADVAVVPGRPGDLAAVCAGQPGGALGPHQAKAVATSSDDGRTWTAIRPCPLNLNKGVKCRLDRGYLAAIATPAAGTIYLAGAAISLEVSRDGGRHWRGVRPPLGGADSDTSQVMFFSRSAGIVIGVDQNAGEKPAIWHTSDGGARWTEDRPVIH